MHKLNVNYSPGFQEDLTSWSMCLYSDGAFQQIVNVWRVSAEEKRLEEHTDVLVDDAVSKIFEIAASIDYEAVSDFLNTFVIDDAELICIRFNGFREITAPFEWIAFMVSRGEAVSESVLQALELWRKVAALSRYLVRK